MTLSGRPSYAGLALNNDNGWFWCNVISKHQFVKIDDLMRKEVLETVHARNDIYIYIVSIIGHTSECTHSSSAMQKRISVVSCPGLTIDNGIYKNCPRRGMVWPRDYMTTSTFIRYLKLQETTGVELTLWKMASGLSGDLKWLIDKLSWAYQIIRGDGSHFLLSWRHHAMETWPL